MPARRPGFASQVFKQPFASQRKYFFFVAVHVAGMAIPGNDVQRFFAGQPLVEQLPGLGRIELVVFAPQNERRRAHASHAFDCVHEKCLRGAGERKAIKRLRGAFIQALVDFGVRGQRK